MDSKAYKDVNNHSHEISGRIILSRHLYARTTHLVGMNGVVKSDLATLAFKIGEQLEDFHGRMIITKQ